MKNFNEEEGQANHALVSKRRKETPEERRAYSRGYQAGQAKMMRDADGLRSLQTVRRDSIFCSVLGGLLANDSKSWLHHDRRVNKADQYVDLAKTITDLAMKEL